MGPSTTKHQTATFDSLILVSEIFVVQNLPSSAELIESRCVMRDVRCTMYDVRCMMYDVQGVR